MPTASKTASVSSRKLYHWLSRQIDLKKNNNLAKDRDERLKKIDPYWQLPNFERRWFNMLQAFIAQKKREKDLYVGWHTPLRIWLHNQKLNFGKLSTEKKKLLEKAGVTKYIEQAGTRNLPYRKQNRKNSSRS